jgi:hypothetical protein
MNSFSHPNVHVVQGNFRRNCQLYDSSVLGNSFKDILNNISSA